MDKYIFLCKYRVVQKTANICTLSHDFVRFSKFFHLCWFATKESLNTPSHLKCAPTLPCETLVAKIAIVQSVADDINQRVKIETRSIFCKQDRAYRYPF